MKKEIEAKFLSVEKDSLRKKLEGCGFDLKTPEYLMRRKTFKFPNLKPGQNKWGRIRQEFNKTTMTVKEILGSGINDVYEAEVAVDSFDEAANLFQACGLIQNAFQENLREVWVNENTEVTIDTWPGLDPFIEIEAENEEIVRKISDELGFKFEEAVFGSIDLIYEKILGIPSEKIIALPEITFANPPKKN